jgi:ElaB/YqjD/DUF883 family membrane-anchored ribosome-binding protein
MSRLDSEFRRGNPRLSDIDRRASATREYVSRQQRMGWREQADRDPEDLERAIDETRAEVRATLDALERRLSGEHIKDVTLGRVRHYGDEVASKLRDNRMPLLMTSIGLAWLMMNRRQRMHRGDWSYGRYGTGDAYAVGRGGFRSDRYGDRYGYGYDTDRGYERFADEPFPERGMGAREERSSMKERIDEHAETARERVSEAASEARERLDSMRDAAREHLQQAGDTVQEHWEDARGRLEQTRERFYHAADSLREGTHRAADMTRERWSRTRSEAEHMMHEQPLVLGALGFAAGALIGAMLPPSEAEDRMIGEARDRAMRMARQAGEHGYREMRERAEQISETAKEQLRQGNGNGKSARGDAEDVDFDVEQRSAQGTGQSREATSGQRSREPNGLAGQRDPEQRPH